MSNRVEVHTREDLPDCPWFVRMFDDFMSGWGESEGKQAIYVAACRDRAEAEVVAANARAREDQRGVAIVGHDAVPMCDTGKLVMLMTHETSAPWYEEGNFAKGGDG